MALELLLKVKNGSQRGSIKLKDVEEILSNSEFTNGEGLLTMTENKNLLMHLAAGCRDEKVLPLVCQAYKRVGLFPRAMATKNDKNDVPIYIAIHCAQFGNSVLLYKECQELSPKALEPKENGWTILHSASQNAENLNLLKFYLSQERCRPMLISRYRRDDKENSHFVLPLDLARQLVQAHEFYVKCAKQSFQRMSNQHDLQYNFMVGPKEKMLEKAKELLSFIEQPTMELQAEENERLAIELEKKKLLERRNQVNSEIDNLMKGEDWETIVTVYILAEMEETQKISVNFLAQRLDDNGQQQVLPPFSDKILDVLMKLLECSTVEDSVILSSLNLLDVYTKDCGNNLLIVELQESLPLVSIVTKILCSIDTNLQCVCASLLSNHFTYLPEDHSRPSDDSTISQPLLLVSHFSSCQEARELASKALKGLRVDSRKEPDPGSWSIHHVSLWMESITEIDKRSEYRKSFFDAGIDGLHLLELSSAEMTGLGVKFVSHQRKISDLIDDLRRRNMRSMVGKKDIFLSYAHIDIKFARKIKNLLNKSNYTVWIDEAGIRVGHKWRNEIADGIKESSCVLFIMTPRSANSEYCQDEIALAEEYHKTIITVKYKDVCEMDPGLKLILQRRQWINFTSESSFQEDSHALIEGVQLVIGEGSGSEEERDYKLDYGGSIIQSPSLEQTPSHHITSPSLDHMYVVDDGSEMSVVGLRQLVREVVAEEFERVREGTGSEALRELVREMVREETERAKYN